MVKSQEIMSSQLFGVCVWKYDECHILTYEIFTTKITIQTSWLEFCSLVWVLRAHQP